MSKEEEISEDTKPNISRLIVISFSAGIFGICVLLIRANFYRPWWNEYIARNLLLLFGLIGLITGYLVIRKTYGRKTYFTLGIILLLIVLQILPIFIISNHVFNFFLGWVLWAIISLTSIVCLICLLIYPTINIMNRWVYGTKIGTFKNDIFVYPGITVGLFLCSIWFYETCVPVSTEVGMGCGLNLEILGKAISIYSKENNGEYPEPNIWCDLLLKNGLIEKDDFICPEVKFRWERQFLPLPIPVNRKSYYAMNPNCEPNSPPDTVLLFEFKGGWNKSGGPELLTTQNHLGLCHVLFNNGDVERIHKSEDITALKWE